MKDARFSHERFFYPSLLFSVAVHGFLLAAWVWPALVPQYAVVKAPGSPEMVVSYRPVVSVLDEETAAKEIIRIKGVRDNSFSLPTQKADVQKESYPPSTSDRFLQGAMTEAKPVSYANTPPLYPQVARQRGWEGIVRLYVLVRKDGKASDVSIEESSGHPVLDQAALKAVNGWKFLPARSGSTYVSTRIILPIQFRLIKD